MSSPPSQTAATNNGPEQADADPNHPSCPKRIRLDAAAESAPDADAQPKAENHADHAEPAAEPADDADAADSVTGEPLSKRARKKLAKLADWQLKKLAKRAAEREKYRQRRVEAIARGQPPTGPSRKALKHNTMAASANRHRIAVDLDFDGLMADKDVCKCAKQLLWVYTINRKAAAPAQLWYTGLLEGSRMQQTLQRNDGYRNWDVNISADGYEQVFGGREQLVYLTSDSDQVLERLSETDVYVIGGLVDHNHHKGLTLQRAEERGLRTARLPLGEHVELKTRTVLTIVHVFDILLRVSGGESWSDAILGVLPSRKGAIAKAKDRDSKAGSDDSAAENDTSDAAGNIEKVGTEVEVVTENIAKD